MPINRNRTSRQAGYGGGADVGVNAAGGGVQGGSCEGCCLPGPAGPKGPPGRPGKPGRYDIFPAFIESFKNGYVMVLNVPKFSTYFMH